MAPLAVALIAAALILGPALKGWSSESGPSLRKSPSSSASPAPASFSSSSFPSPAPASLSSSSSSSRSLPPATADRYQEIDKDALRKAQELKVVRAFRLTAPVRLDGRLEEEDWRSDAHPPAVDFLQSDPVEGAPSSERTEVWVAYDDSSLYVAAYCHDSDPQGVIGLLGRRDSSLDSDWFTFCVDPYFDRRSGYSFSVNPAGSIVDMALSNDISEDTSWDGIWEARAARVADGWTLEMRVPFDQLRFARRDAYVWGVNFQRVIKRKNERTAFAWVPKDDSAFVSRFARLEGIAGIDPGRRVELYPYTVGQAQFRPAEPGNPFETGHRYTGNAGFDLKVGLKSNLNLDVSVNPDFGQVEVDPAVINLSAYETYYQEKRPFFIEGASIFNNFGRGGVYLNANLNWPNPRLFYSRRIGRAPQGYPLHDGYTRLPDRTTILGAFKLTGRVGGGWNLSLVNAVTAREYATVDDLESRYRDEVEPLTYYGVLRAQKDINGGAQGLGVMATAVVRDLDGEALSAVLNRDAFSLAVDGWSFLDKKRSWVVGGWLGGTLVEGTQEDIYRLQRSSMHYFQRPDVTHVSLDPEATSLAGWAGEFKLARQQGRSLILFNAGALSPGFDPNDAGYQSSGSDVVNFMALYGYQWTKPGKLLRQWLVIGGFGRQYDFGWNKTYDMWVLSFQGTMANWWSFESLVGYMPECLSGRLTRGGPLALLPPGWLTELSLGTDSRKPVVLQGAFSYQHTERKQTEWSAELSLRWKPRTNLSLSVGPMVAHDLNETQWLTRVADPLMTETYGSRYVFGRIDQRIVAAEVRVNWIFTPTLSLQAYLQPFIAVGKYDRFKQLNRPRAYDYLVYGEGGSTIAPDNGGWLVDPDGAGPAPAFSLYDPDFNYKSMRGTVVLRWEYRPGSLLYLVWTQNRADYSYPGDLSLWRDLGSLFTAPGDNIFLLKFSYRFDL